MKTPSNTTSPVYYRDFNLCPGISSCGGCRSGHRRQLELSRRTGVSKVADVLDPI